MVKVRETQERKLASLPSLAIAIAAAALILMCWWLVHEEPHKPAAQRTIENIIVTWECPSGKRYLAKGSLLPFTCQDGSGTGTILLTYESDDCSEFELYARYAQNENGDIILSAVRKPGTDTWTSIEDIVRCPETGSPAKTVSFPEGTASLQPR